jgi:hypothetical protein
MNSEPNTMVISDDGYYEPRLITNLKWTVGVQQCQTVLPSADNKHTNNPAEQHHVFSDDMKEARAI